MKKSILFAVIVLSFTQHCVSSSPPAGPSAACSPAHELLGSWRSYRTSSMGPAWMSFTFRCDCTVRVVSQLLFMRYTEVAQYRIEDDALVFTREHSETRWPFSFAADVLLVQEAPGESHRYTRTSAAGPCRETSRVQASSSRDVLFPGHNRT